MTILSTRSRPSPTVEKKKKSVQYYIQLHHLWQDNVHLHITLSYEAYEELAAYTFL